MAVELPILFVIDLNEIQDTICKTFSSSELSFWIITEVGLPSMAFQMESNKTRDSEIPKSQWQLLMAQT